jgi:hypothetical protein
VFLLALPPLFLKMATWSALALKLTFLPLALFRRLHPWIRLCMVGLHLGLAFLVNFADLTLGMLTFFLTALPPVSRICTIRIK